MSTSLTPVLSSLKKRVPRVSLKCYLILIWSYGDRQSGLEKRDVIKDTRIRDNVHILQL